MHALLDSCHSLTLSLLDSSLLDHVTPRPCHSSTISLIAHVIPCSLTPCSRYLLPMSLHAHVALFCNRLPTHCRLLSCLPACLPACLSLLVPICPHSVLALLDTFVHVHAPCTRTHLHACMHACTQTRAHNVFLPCVILPLCQPSVCPTGRLTD